MSLRGSETPLFSFCLAEKITPFHHRYRFTLNLNEILSLSPRCHHRSKAILEGVKD